MRLLVVIVLFLSVGCAQRRTNGPEENVGEPTGSIGDLPPSQPSIFPHPEDWANPASHGAWVVQFDSKTCLECHKTDSTTAESAPTCNSCHPLFPHDPDWVKKENHGDEVLSNGRGSCVGQCHGTDLQGGLSGVSCNLCHTTYPHPTGWAAPVQHGLAAKGSGKSLCQGCHGSDLLGGKAGVSCRQCHTIYPHDADWGEPDQHGATALSQGTSSCATLCHGADLKGGLSGISCNSCHDLYPHSDQWGEDHRSTALTLGTGACQPCHGANLRTLLDGKNCYSCHKDYLHPDPSKWLPFTGGHGQRVNSVYSGSTATCQACHGADLKTVKPNGKDCFTCHPSYPHDQFSTADWGTYEGHGQYTLPSSKKPECQLCHGVDYSGGPRGNPSCSSCHASYPHIQPGWLRNPGEPQDHGNYVAANTSASCATARCHGTGLVPTPGVTQGPGCDSCHSSYPHAPDWSSGIVHGTVALAGISLCKGCHGYDLSDIPPGFQTCQQCHPSYLQHESAELGGANWDTYAGHGTFLKGKGWNAAECKDCHGADLLGGISHISCKSCHASFPHDSAGWETATGHPTYIASTLSGNLTACKVCHGNDLKGGHSGVSCNSCHTYYPHDVTWALPANHGVAAYGSGKNSCDSSQCHKSDFSGSPPTIPSCAGCHADFPHTNPNWRTGALGLAGNVHASTFAERTNGNGVGDDVTACQKCHGANYDRPVGGAACTKCHPGGVTHRPGWSTGAKHGTYFSKKYTAATSNEAFCKDCHGHPNLSETFLPGDTQLSRAAKSDCYKCHWNYPHPAYFFPPMNASLDWAPMDADYPDKANTHIFYLVGTGSKNNPIYDASGNKPAGNKDFWLAALHNSCGGMTAGSCHFEGLRSTDHSLKSAACSSLCHNASLPPPP